MKLEELEQEALKLPVEGRAKLAHALILSLDEDEGPPDPEHERLWQEEIQRRCRDIDEGRAELIEGEEAFRRARAALR
jgi:putative addiction module component (TIGR02574 family)